MRDNHKQLTYCPPRHEELKYPVPLGILNSKIKDLNNISVMFLREDNNNYKQDGGTQSVYFARG